jgi:PAS domain S-box-containing protein
MPTTLTSPNAIIIADLQGYIQYWSSGAEKLFGYRKSEAEGQLLDLIVPQEYRERHWAGFRRAIETGVSHLDGARANIPVCCQDGIVRLFPGRFMLLKDARDSLAGAMAIYAVPSGQEQPWGPVV